MGAKNAVVNGDYKGKLVNQVSGKAYINIGLFKKDIDLNSGTIESYEVMNEEHQKSASSAVGRAAVGSLLLGPIGLLAGVSAKTKGAYMVAVQFKDGKRSLLEVDEKIYKAIMSSMF